MLSFCVVWVVFAAAVTLLEMFRRSLANAGDSSQTQANESGSALAVIAVVSCLALFAGFVYVGRYLVSGL
jgi:heme/copper-type cytochrome/quinol oxidase subunit 2